MRVPSLEAAEERWRLTIDNAPVGIALVALDGGFDRVNDALCAILGYRPEQLMRLSFQDITHPDDLETDLKFLDQLVHGQIPSYRLRKRYLHGDGHVVWADLSVALVRNAAGEPMHLVSHVADLTEEMTAATRIEQMNAELSEKTARLEQSNADLEAFAMLVSHDLQAPLSTVLGYLQLLESEYAEVLGPQGADWVGRASSAASRMSQLVNSLLTMSRSDRAMQRVPLSLSELVVDVCADLDPLIQEHGAMIEVQEDALVVWADPGRLRQVIQNLVQNALKYRQPHRPPAVSVAVEVDGVGERGWLVTVDDNAVTIPVERREQVFGLFERLDVDERETGHGIGLAACRRIVQRHGGRIWIEDNPAGEGNRFRFTLRR